MKGVILESKLVPKDAVTPFVATIPTGQWSGSGSDRYITVQASNVTANSVLVPHYDSASEALLNGQLWCVPANGSFTIHTSAIPSGTVTVMVQLLGTLGEANYQVLADVYSTSQVDSIVAQSTAFMRVLGTYTGTTGKSTFVFQNVVRKNWLVICNMNLYVASWASAQNLILYNIASGAAATNYTITGDYTVEINGLQWYDNPWAISLA